MDRLAITNEEALPWLVAGIADPHSTAPISSGVGSVAAAGRVRAASGWREKPETSVACPEEARRPAPAEVQMASEYSAIPEDAAVTAAVGASVALLRVAGVDGKDVVMQVIQDSSTKLRTGEIPESRGARCSRHPWPRVNK